MAYFQLFSRTHIFENRVAGTYLSPPMEMQGLDKLTGVQLPLRYMSSLLVSSAPSFFYFPVQGHYCINVLVMCVFHYF